jgi:hypothetical protein
LGRKSSLGRGFHERITPRAHAILSHVNAELPHLGYPDIIELALDHLTNCKLFKELPTTTVHGKPYRLVSESDYQSQRTIMLAPDVLDVFEAIAKVSGSRIARPRPS